MDGGENAAVSEVDGTENRNDCFVKFGCEGGDVYLKKHVRIQRVLR